MAMHTKTTLLVGMLVALAVTCKPALAADEGSDKWKWPDGFKPLILGEPDGPASVRLAITAQALYEMDVDSVDTRDAHLTDYGGKFRRLRFVLSGHLGLPRLKWLLHLSTLPGSLELMDFWLEYGFNEWFLLRAGNLKIPFGRFRNGSFKGLCMVDWPIVTTYFGAERQKGFVLHNGYGKNAGLQYELGVMTGVASRPPHARGLASMYGESVPNPSDLTGPARNERIHPELVLHIAYNHGKFQHATEADIDGGPPRLSVGVSVAWDTRPQHALDLSLRLSPELLVKAYGLHVLLAGFAGFAELGGRDISDTAFALVGAVAQAGYTYNALVDVSVQYAMMASSADLRADARDRASRIISSASTHTELLDLLDQYEDAGAFEQRHELSLGLTFFIIGTSLKWSNDLAWLATTTAGEELHEMRFRMQLQLDF